MKKVIVNAVLAISCFAIMGCHGMWTAREAEMLKQGYTQTEVDKMIAEAQEENKEAILKTKNTIIDMLPVPIPKEPIKDITDYWTEALLVLAGAGGMKGVDRLRKPKSNSSETTV